MVSSSMTCVLIEASSEPECLAKIEELQQEQTTTAFTTPQKTGNNSYISFGRYLVR